MPNNRRKQRQSVDHSFSHLSLKSQLEIATTGYARVIEELPTPTPTPSPPGIQTRIVRYSDVGLGLDPSCLAGKYLSKVHQGEVHPFYHLGFSDGTCYKIHLEDYQPTGTRELRTESTPGFAELVKPFLRADYTGRPADPVLIEGCSFAVLKDTESRKRGLARVYEHHTLAFKVGGRWRSVWGSYKMPEEQPDRWPGKTLHVPFLVQLNWRGKEIKRKPGEMEDVSFR